MGEPSEILDVPVSETARQLVEVPESASEDRTQQWIVEHIVGIPVPQVVEELVEVCKDRTGFNSVLTSRPSKLLTFASQRRLPRNLLFRCKHVVSQSQFTDKGVDIPVVEDRQNCMNQC